MNKKCPDCGSLNTEEVFDNESYCKDCFLHCATADLEDATIFDVITQSPEVLAPNFVVEVITECRTAKFVTGYRSTIIPYKKWNLREEAIAATVAKLKEVANGN